MEIGRRYDVPDGIAVPLLSGVGAVASAAEPVEHHLDAIYYDT